ncbi:unnamed protein product [Heterobilharzia americana]|nr:unnamed protein product [Heterobilharzia americana]CAH8642032.1 unnamed protein product [Heterobilharzia americana]
MSQKVENSGYDLPVPKSTLYKSETKKSKSLITEVLPSSVKYRQLTILDVLPKWREHEQKFHFRQQTTSQCYGNTWRKLKISCQK